MKNIKVNRHKAMKKLGYNPKGQKLNETLLIK